MRRRATSIRSILAAVLAASAALCACHGGSEPSTTTRPGPAGADVLTWHNDTARTGQNAAESTLTPTTVNSNHFGLRALWSVDGLVDAQPLYASAVSMPDGLAHNLLLAATEHASVYAFDAETGATLWKTSLLGVGEAPSDDRGCGQVSPEIGVTSSPVIDRTRGIGGVIYAVAMSKSGSQYFQRLHALDLTTGREMPGSPVTVQATYPGTGDNSVSGQVVFDAKQYKERAALLLVNGAVITTWASHCDIPPYTGWIIAYDAATLTQRSVLNITPNGSGGSNWASGAGPAADASGTMFYLAANGTFDTSLTAAGRPSSGDYGNAFVKVATASALSVLDYFTMLDTVAQSNADNDFGSGGAMLLPDEVDAGGHVRHLALGAGKDTNIYVVDRDAMGGFDPAANHNLQVIAGALSGGVYAAPAYFNGKVYYGAVGDSIKAFAVGNAVVASMPVSQTGNVFPYPGATPSISANGTSGGIVWAVENSNPAVLHAYDATDLSKELYNSNQAGTRDQFGPGNKFITPTVVAGKVFVGTPNAVAVFAPR
jgi:hypothetical protein